MAIVHAIGSPENDSERRAIAYLANTLPGSDYVIFHNLELSTHAGLPYEYDIIVVGEYAVYVLEVKGYQGRITGNASEWQLESGAIYKSPIPLTNKKAKVVSDRIRRFSSLLESVWVQPLIVLSDNNARVSIADDQAQYVLTLESAGSFIQSPGALPIAARPITRHTDRICDAVFRQFKPLRRRGEIGDYQVVETIGKTELFTTFLARHKYIATEARFFLKVYTLDVYASEESREKHRELILRDANALHRIGRHPNVVGAHPPFAWEHNKIVLPIDWVDGYSLAGLLEEGKRFSFQESIAICRQLVSGLLQAHQKGVLHRDVRPQNVILRLDGAPVWVNFDCARIEGGDLRTIASSVGRYLDERFAAPEVMESPAQASVLSDQYSLGVLFFHLCTGEVPYRTISEVIGGRGLPLRPSALNPAVSEELDGIIMKMCAFDRHQRYGGLASVEEDLLIISD